MDEHWRKAASVLGVPALRYLLALDHQEEAAGFVGPPGNPAFTERQQAALLHLARVCDALIAETAAHPPPDLPTGDEADPTLPAALADATETGNTARHRSFLLDHHTRVFFGEYLPHTAATRAATFRAECGADLFERTDPDPVTHHLLAIAADLYGLSLLPDRRASHSPLSFNVFQHPRNAAFREAVLTDPTLTKLFPGTDDSGQPAGSYIAPNRAGGPSIELLSGQLLSTAIALARLQVATPTFEDLADHICETVALLRRLVEGRTVDLPVRAALAGVRPPDGTERLQMTPDPSTSTGDQRTLVLRPASQRDLWLQSFTGLSDNLVSTGQDGETTTISYGGDVIVESTAPYNIHLEELEDFNWPADLQALNDPLGKVVEDLRVGLMLATIQDPPVVLMQAWVATIDPLGQAPIVSWSDLRHNYKLLPHQLDEAATDSWCEWTRRLRHLPASASLALSIAKRRPLTAATERQSPEDVLVDSVMVWESLVGAAGETTFRVCASIACLLESHLEERRALLKELKGLYRLRSDTVHGSTQLKPGDATTPGRTMQIAADLMRVMVRDRPDLLKEKSAQIRSDRILLGF